MTRHKSGQKWQPSPKQRSVLHAATKLGYNRTITAICEEAGVNRKSYYRWMENDEGFRDAWHNLWKVIIEKYMPTATMALGRKAAGGDVAATRLLAQMGELLVEKREVKHDFAEGLTQLAGNLSAPWQDDGQADLE